jgi:hypothetical protein
VGALAGGRRSQGGCGRLAAFESFSAAAFFEKATCALLLDFLAMIDMVFSLKRKKKACRRRVQ